MTHRKRASVALLVFGFVALGLSGCVGVGGCNGDPATTGLIKVETGQMTQLTPAEVEALVQSVALQQGLQLPPLTDAQAQAVVDILNANGINSIGDVAAFIQKAEQDPSSVVIPPSAMELLPSVLELLQSLSPQPSPAA